MEEGAFGVVVVVAAIEGEAVLLVLVLVGKLVLFFFYLAFILTWKPLRLNIFRGGGCAAHTHIRTHTHTHSLNGTYALKLVNGRAGSELLPDCQHDSLSA